MSVRFDAGPPHGVGDYVGYATEDGVPHGQVRIATKNCYRVLFTRYLIYTLIRSILLLKIYGSTTIIIILLVLLYLNIYSPLLSYYLYDPSVFRYFYTTISYYEKIPLTNSK